MAPSQPEFHILHYPRISKFLSNEGAFEVGWVLFWLGFFYLFFFYNFFTWLMQETNVF